MLFLRFHDRGDRIRCNKHIYQCLTSKIRHLLSICCSFIHAMICCSPNVTDKHWQLNYVYVYIYMIIIYVYSMCFFFTILYAHIFATNAIYRWMFLLPLNVHLGQRFRRSLWPSNRSNRCLALHRKLHKKDISGN